MKKDRYYPISIGSNCIIAHHLKKLGLRKESFPFDWLSTTDCNVFTNLTSLIRNNFSDFLKDLTYNEEGIVYSQKYPDTSFVHHDLIKDQNENGKLTTIMQRRADRFLKRISEREPLFIQCFDYPYTNDPDIIEYYWYGVKEFQDELNSRGISCKILIVVYCDEEFEINHKFEKSLTNIGVEVRKFVRDREHHKDFGHYLDFKPILDEFYTLSPFTIYSMAHTWNIKYLLN